MNLSQIIYKFNNQAYSQPRTSTLLSNLRVKKLIKLVGKNNRVLDVGCYDGTISRQIANQDNQVVGIDISRKAAAMARKKGITAFSLNIEEQSIPTRLGRFDVVVAGEIIEHVFDPDSFLKKLHAVLKPGGQLLITTPNLAGIGSRLSLLAGRLPWMVENDLLPGKSGHIRYFTLLELEKILNRHRFRVIVKSTDSVGFGSVSFPFLDKLFPTLGRILIVKAKKI